MSVQSPAPTVNPVGSESPRNLADLLVSVKDRFEHCRARFETAEARIELAKRLASMGWVEPAAREATAALEIVSALGTQAGHSSERSTPSSSPATGPDVEALTPRERQVLSLLAEGLTNRQIGSRLTVSEHTAHHHVAHILRKLGLPSRAAAAAYAVTSGSAGSPVTTG